MHGDDDPLRPHSHDPNPNPPSADPAFSLRVGEQEWRLTPDILRRLPRLTIPDCYIVSTGHGASGPFTFGGIPLLALVDAYAHGQTWEQVEVVSGDGFGTRLSRAELAEEKPMRCSLLALEIDGRSLTRDDGLVRLIVPSEAGDALRQIKWIGRITVV
ncbi:MAG: molybdopterin-dependent oxidoreductase [Chloroflexota bacterium]